MEASKTEVSNPKLKLKLLIDNKSNKVLFAETNKGFVDFLFSLVSLPLGTVVKLLKDGMVGSMGDLYASISSIDREYIQSSRNIESILNSRPPTIALKNSLFLSNESMTRKAYMCLYEDHKNASYKKGHGTPTVYHHHVSDYPNMSCPECYKAMSYELEFVEMDKWLYNGNPGFVRELVTYMVMDNLEVKPLSTRSIIALMKSFDVTDLSALEEKVVDVGVSEAPEGIFGVQECANKSFPFQRRGQMKKSTWDEM